MRAETLGATDPVGVCAEEGPVDRSEGSTTSREGVNHDVG